MWRAETGNGGIGASYPAALEPPFSISLLHDATGAVLRPGDGTVQLLLETQPSTSYRYDSVDLRFRVNGGAERTQRLPASGTVCVAPERPGACPSDE